MEERLTAEAQFQKAFALYQSGDAAGAQEVCRQVLALAPENFHALNLLGVLSLLAGRTGDGVALLQKAAAIDPKNAAAQINLGNGLRDLKRPQEALGCYARAVRLAPDSAEAWSNRGMVLADLRRPWEALESLDRALVLRPGFAEAHGNRAGVLIEMKRYAEALASADAAIALRPTMAKAWGGRGMALNKLRRHAEAAQAYAQLLELEPLHPFMKGLYLYQKMQSCDWRGLGPLMTQIADDIEAGRPTADPFGWQGAAHSPRSLMLCARQFALARFPASPRAFAPRLAAADGKIRIGYVSGEFREHATALLLVGVLEQHDKSRFEIFAFDNGWDDGGDTRARINRAVRVIPIGALSDTAAADAIHAAGIDILVNLNGYFGGDRSLVFAQKPAPLQVNYLGFPGTLGADYIDYVIADARVIPEDEEKFFSEKVVTLPFSYQANDRDKKIAPRVFTRAECGLPPEGFVFCCFNNNYKILPEMFSIWMRILAQVEGSVLWLLADNELASTNLRKEAATRGIAPGRLVFAPRLPLADHLARHALADLFLDTLPYNAHTTASDALWAGLPVLTCRGTTFAGRVAASLLSALGLPELIAPSLEAYYETAITLARHPARLTALKQKLADKRLTAPLFDTPRFTRHLEAAYSAMMARLRAKLAPDRIEIAPA